MLFSLSFGRAQHILLKYRKKNTVNDMLLTFKSNFPSVGVVIYQHLLILSVPLSN